MLMAITPSGLYNMIYFEWPQGWLQSEGSVMKLYKAAV